MSRRGRRPLDDALKIWYHITVKLILAEKQGEKEMSKKTISLAPYLTRNLSGHYVTVQLPYSGNIPVPVLEAHCALVRWYDHKDHQLNGVIRDTLSHLSEKDRLFLLAYTNSEEKNPTGRPSIEIAAKQLNIPCSTYNDALKLAMTHFKRTHLKTFHVRGLNG